MHSALSFLVPMHGPDRFTCALRVGMLSHALLLMGQEASFAAAVLCVCHSCAVPQLCCACAAAVLCVCHSCAMRVPQLCCACAAAVRELRPGSSCTYNIYDNSAVAIRGQ